MINDIAQSTANAATLEMIVTAKRLTIAKEDTMPSLNIAKAAENPFMWQRKFRKSQRSIPNGLKGKHTGHLLLSLILPNFPPRLMIFLLKEKSDFQKVKNGEVSC